jgi:TonB family protein
MNQSDTWFDGVARNLIRHAAGKAPPGLAERLGEEWLADLGARPGGWSQLRFALGCCWATTVIANELGAPVGAAAAAAVDKTTMVQHAASMPWFSRRGTVFVVIVGLHVLVVGVLATAIEAPNVFKVSPPRTDVSFLPKPAAPLPPTPADPTLVKFWPDPPPPEGPTIPAEQAVTPDQIAGLQGAHSAGSASSKPVNRVPGGPGAGFPNPDDFYPEGAIRLREKGLAMVNVCVDGSGQLITKPTIDQSSGSARLDGAALKLARAGSGHYRPTTEDGRAVSACYPLRVRFQFRE